MSSESDEEIKESSIDINYRRKYQMLLERCEILQQDNERLVHRIQRVYSYTKQLRKETQFIVNRLNKYEDDWIDSIEQQIYLETSQLPAITQKANSTQNTGNSKLSKKSYRSKKDGPPSNHRKRHKEKVKNQSNVLISRSEHYEPDQSNSTMF